jgi:O-antigen/teichoic acid export membrane protein
MRTACAQTKTVMLRWGALMLADVDGQRHTPSTRGRFHLVEQGRHALSLGGGRGALAWASPKAAIGRLGWGVADQGVSSVGNFALGIAVARALRPEDFGAFALALVTYGVVLNASRGLATDPMVVRFSRAERAAWRRAVSTATGTALSVGAASGIGCVLVGLALPDPARGALVALGCGLPGLMLQDAWRFAFFSAGQPAKAMVNDLAWGTLQIAMVVGLVLTGRATVVTCVLAFGGSAALAAGFGWWQLRLRPRPDLIRSWLTQQRSLGGRYLVENVSISGARQLRMSAIAALVGLAAVGQVRAAEILMGPFMVILMGVSQVAVPEAVHVLHRSPSRLTRFCLYLGGAQALAALAWGAAMFVLVPGGLGHLLLGDLWAGAFALLLPVLLNMAIGCFENGAISGVRALGASRHSLAAQLSNAGLYLVGGIGGAAVNGAAGSCWGVAGASTIATAIWWQRLRRAQREHLAQQQVGTLSRSMVLSSQRGAP